VVNLGGLLQVLLKMAIVTTLATLEMARRLDAYTAGALRVPAAVLVATALLWWFVIRVPPSTSLKGRRLLITGAAHGLGEALAVQAAARGATLVLWDIDGEALAGVGARARDALRATGAPVGDADARAVQCKAVDVADEEAVCRARDEALRAGGEQDTVVSCAAMLHGGVGVAALSGAQLARTLAVNVGGPLALVRHLLHHLSAGLSPQAPGARRTLCFVSSVMGAGLGARGVADYAASKAALSTAVECLRQEVNGDKALRGRLGVHLVSPWLVDTDMFKGAYASERAPWVERAVLRAVPPLRREALAAHILDGLALRHGAHWVTFSPFFVRFAAYLPRLLQAVSLPAYDALLGSVGGAAGMDKWQGSEWNRRQCLPASVVGVPAGGAGAAVAAAAAAAAAAAPKPAATT
jgi:NAD(P)-dependent dehydrogenase (short-subunit alcohol dehydrogenase family)